MASHYSEIKDHVDRQTYAFDYTFQLNPGYQSQYICFYLDGRGDNQKVQSRVERRG